MSDAAIIYWSFPIAIGCVFIILNFSNISDVKWFRKVAKELKNGHYNYHATLITQMVFRRIDDREEIIFFGDGSIKVMDDVYIHKGMLWMSVFNMYYYWKFHKLKDVVMERQRFKTIRDEFTQMRTNRNDNYQNIYVKKHEPFKFFRG
jgi:hypothetical protein